MRRESLGIALVFVLQLLCVASAYAEAKPSPEHEAIAQTISETMMSPFCPGRTISSCPSDQARNLRGQIITWLEQGYTEPAVRNQLKVLYGAEVTGVPKAEGFGLVGWWMPAVFVLLSVALVLLKLRRMKSTFVPQVERKLDPKIQARLEAEMRGRV